MVIQISSAFELISSTTIDPPFFIKLIAILNVFIFASGECRPSSIMRSNLLIYFLNYLMK